KADCTQSRSLFIVNTMNCKIWEWVLLRSSAIVSGRILGNSLVHCRAIAESFGKAPLFAFRTSAKGARTFRRDGIGSDRPSGEIDDNFRALWCGDGMSGRKCYVHNAGSTMGRQKLLKSDDPHVFHQSPPRRLAPGFTEKSEMPSAT